MIVSASLTFLKARVGITTPTTPEEHNLSIGWSVTTPTLSAVNDAGSLSTANISATLPTLSGSCDQGIVFPAPTLEAAAVGGGVSWADLEVTLPTISSIGLTGSASTAELEIPKPTLEAYTQNSIALTLPAPTLSATCLTGSVGSLDVTLKQIALAAEGYAGTVSTATLTLPLVEIDGTAYSPSVSTVELTIPLLQLTATAHGPEASVQTVLVMNADTNALTTYSSFDFNSLTEFNGVFLGASSSGIYALTGDLDEAAVIAATVRLGKDDFGDEHLKRAESAYVAYTTDGSLTLKVTADEGTEYSYTLERRQTDKIHQSRVKLGKGMKGRYFQTELVNVAGADFELDDLGLVVNAIKRKV